MSDKLMFNCTYGKDEPERATLPFVAANIAATAGQDAVVLCTIEAVWLGTTGGTDGIAQPGLPVLDDLYREFIDNGGTVWVCGACAKPRGIGDEQLRKGSVIVGAAGSNVVHQTGARLQCRPCHRGLTRVDGNRHLHLRRQAATGGAFQVHGISLHRAFAAHRVSKVRPNV